MFTLFSGPTLMNKTADTNNPNNDTISNMTHKFFRTKSKSERYDVLSTKQNTKENIREFRKVYQNLTLNRI